jgi:hypothetical protein
MSTVAIYPESPSVEVRRLARLRRNKVRQAWFWIWPALMGAMLGLLSTYACFVIFLNK